MGLDITAYRKLKTETGVPESELDKYPSPYVRFGASMDWSEGVWPGRGAPLDSKVIYSYEDEFTFRAGSYSGYGAWRHALGKFAACGENRDDFAELVDFADNEGVIGQVVSTKLAADFARNADRAVLFRPWGVPDQDEWWRAQYRNWRKAFDMAADGGAVEFH